MAINRTIVRPLTAQTENETSAQSAAITEGASFWYVDFTATVNSNLRLLARLKITPDNIGKTQRFRVQLLDFSSAADTTFTTGATTTPFTEAEADSITDIGYSDFIDMHALYVTAGDTTAS